MITLILQKKHITSNASRHIRSFKSLWLSKSDVSTLTFRKKWLAGRSSLNGRIIIRSKGSTLRRIRLFKVNNTFRSAVPGVVSTLRLVPFSNKLLSLVCFPSGSCTYLPTLETTLPFSIFSFRTTRSQFTSLNKFAAISLILSAPKFRKLSHVELWPGKGSQYARSSGTSAKVIKVDLSTHLALIKLPSGVRKFFSIYGTIMLGPAALKLKRKSGNTKSGYWRSYGCKNQVRGVAMNPVDHPHGGRTKAIKYPRTPWGKTTKRK